MGQDDARLGEFDGEIVCEHPNNLLNKFEGILIWKGRTFSLDNDKVSLSSVLLAKGKFVMISILGGLLISNC